MAVVFIFSSWWQESVEHDVREMLNSLKQCKSLSRVSLAIPNSLSNMPTEELTGLFVDFCDNLNQLVALFGALNVPSEACRQLNPILLNKFKKERPAFCVDIQSFKNNSASYRSEEIAAMHRDVLLRIASNVGILPHNHGSILQRLF